MSQTKTVSINLVSPMSLLTVVFITLKLLDKIDWSWWWVLAPTWIPAALGLTIMGLGAVIMVAAAILKSK